ncbi:MAG: TVP38/TMEM64 family protein [Desulfovibrionaceae bacterium]
MKQLTSLLIVSSILCIFWYFDLFHYISFETLTHFYDTLANIYKEKPYTFMISFFFIYLTAATLALPGVIFLGFFSGSVMGFSTALLIDSFASTIGASGAFLLSRYLFQDHVKRFFPKEYQKINKGIEEEGAYYLFTLRIIPFFPYFLVNVLSGLTSLPLRTYYIVSQIGMFPVTALVVKTGSELGLIETPSQIFSPTILILLTTIGLFPWIARRLLLLYKSLRDKPHG